jgi:hypothetical protein
MLLMQANPLRGQVGGGWAQEIKTFLGLVKWHRAVRRVPFGPRQKKLRFPWPNPLPLALVMDFPASKALRKWLYQSEVHRQFYVHDL